jgi:hypothetical protein
MPRAIVVQPSTSQTGRQAHEQYHSGGRARDGTCIG